LLEGGAKIRADRIGTLALDLYRNARVERGSGASR
jgi:hypothetical protein